MLRLLSNYKWHTRDGSVAIKDMDINHIKKIRNYINDNNNEIIAGVSKTTWLLALNTELTYRINLGNELLRAVDKNSTLRNAINKCLKEPKKITYATRSINPTLS